MAYSECLAPLKLYMRCCMQFIQCKSVIFSKPYYTFGDPEVTTFITIRTKLVLFTSVGAPVIQWAKRWPTDPAVLGTSPT